MKHLFDTESTCFFVHYFHCRSAAVSAGGPAETNHLSAELTNDLMECDSLGLVPVLKMTEGQWWWWWSGGEHDFRFLL